MVTLNPYLCQENATILRNEQLAEHIYRLTLKSPHIAAAAQPGQFVMVRVSDRFDPLLRRPFSLHQTTNNGTIQILFKIVGVGTKNLATMRPDQGLNLIGPLGKGFCFQGEGPFCLIGGGMGVAPLLFAAKVLAQKRANERIFVLLGGRTEKEMVVAPDFRTLGVKTYLATEDGTIGHHGMVTDLMGSIVESGGRWSAMACGPMPMIQAVAKRCREYRWECQVSIESFMACGMGTCLGCAMPMREKEAGFFHVCSDGPVFNIQELGWYNG